MIVYERVPFVKTRMLAMRLLAALFEALNAICSRLGLRKNSVVEAAIREKIEDLLDAEDLREAVKGATGFHSWEDAKAEVGKKGRKYPIEPRAKAERDADLSLNVIRSMILYTLAAGVKFLYLSTATLCDR